MLNIDKQLLTVLQESSCFGIAHDESTPECKRCDVRLQCKQKVEGANIQAPTIREMKEPAPKPKEEAKVHPAKKTVTPKAKPEAKAKADKPAKKTKASVSYDPNMPDWKPMSLGELKNLAVERQVTWTEYDSEQITRMRLIMNLKKSYEIS